MIRQLKPERLTSKSKANARSFDCGRERSSRPSLRMTEAERVLVAKEVLRLRASRRFAQDDRTGIWMIPGI